MARQVDALRARLVFRRWHQPEELDGWRSRAVAALARCAAPAAAADEEAIDIGVEDIRMESAQELVDKMVDRRLAEEGFAGEGADASLGERRRGCRMMVTLQDGDAAAAAAAASNSRRRLRRKAEQAEQAAGAAAPRQATRSRSRSPRSGVPVEGAGEPAAAASSAVVAAEAASSAVVAAEAAQAAEAAEAAAAAEAAVVKAAGSAEAAAAAAAVKAAIVKAKARTPLLTIDDISRLAAERAPLQTVELLDAAREWRKSTPSFLLANRHVHFYQFRNAAAEEPHAWWTQRLAPPSGGGLEAQRRRAEDEVVLTVAVCDKHGRKEQEYDILASQRLHDLRDALYFVSDWMYDGPTRLPSASFFIDGVFYNDDRHPQALNYAHGIIEWLKDTREPGFVKEDRPRSMSTRLADLPRIPFGEKCIYVHQGDVEHAVYFTNARLLRSHDDCPFCEAYPMLTFMRRFNKRKCSACVQNFAIWVVLDSSRCPHNPSFWCQTCFRHFFQDKDGNFYPPLDYKVFPYLHDET